MAPTQGRRWSDVLNASLKLGLTSFGGVSTPG
jgi:hypothetical protein